MATLHRWFGAMALSAISAHALAACSGGDGAVGLDGGSPDAATGALPGTGGAVSSGGSSSGGSSSGGVPVDGGGGSEAADASTGGAGIDSGSDAGFVSQLPRPLSLPRPPNGRLPADLLPPRTL
ncbi:MAG TPA: hypothetical protein VHU80_07945 [Polyangiaceae bacterium]|nr:hypothetical protein [Polyangiaceae bacterium]